MSNKTEYSRLLLKRSTIPFQVPTVPTGSTIDNTWLTTDLLVGEGFLNAFDDKLFYRTLNGIIEVPMSGFSSSNFYTDSAILSGTTLIFNRTDTPAAYSVDLSSIAGSGTTGNFLPLSGGSLTSSAIITNDANDSTFQFNYLGSDVILLSTATGITKSFLALDDTSCTLKGFQNASIVSASNQITVNGVTKAIEYIALSGHSFEANNNLTSLDMYNDISMVANGAMSLNSSGFTTGVVGTELQILDNQNGPVGIANVTESAAILLTTQNSTIGQGSYRSAIVGGGNNNIGSGSTSSVIIAGVGNSINNGVINSVVVGGNSLTATENNTLYCQNLSVAGTVSGITQTKEIFFSPTFGYGNNSLKGNYFPFYTDGGVDPLFIQGVIPFDVSTILSSEVVSLPEFTASEVTEMDLSYGGIGQSFSANTLVFNSSVTYSADTFTSIDVLPLFSGTSANDVFGFNIFQNNQKLFVIGLKIKYTT